MGCKVGFHSYNSNEMGGYITLYYNLEVQKNCVTLPSIERRGINEIILQTLFSLIMCQVVSDINWDESVSKMLSI